jgi:hypothetical protein
MKKILLTTLTLIITYTLFAQSDEKDIFDSHIISLILAWISAVPIFVFIIHALTTSIFVKHDSIPRVFIIWVGFCAILFGPIRYIFLQIILATAFPYQSWAALISDQLFSVFFIGFGFSIYYGITVGLPLYCTLLIAGLDNQIIKKSRLYLASICAPFLIGIGAQLFYLLLPFAAYSTHWLNPYDVIGATNGPAEYYYKYLVEPLEPNKTFNKFNGVPTSYAGRVGGTFGMTGLLPAIDIFEGHQKRQMRIADSFFKGLSSKDRLRLHVASIYLRQDKYEFYVSHAHSDFLEDQGMLLYYKTD